MPQTSLTSRARDSATEPRGEAPAKEGYSVRILDTIEEVDPEEWSSVVDADDLLASHRFVRACERSEVENAAYRHVLISRAGRIECCASFCLLRIRLELLSAPALQSFARAIRLVYPPFLESRFLVCGLPVSLGQSTLRFRPGSDRAELMNLLDDVMADLARALDAHVLCWKEFGDAESSTLERLLERGYLRAPSLPYFRLDVHWRDFDDYVSQMRSGYRRQIQKTLAVRQDSDLRIRHVADYSPMIPRFYELYEQVMDRAEFQLERLSVQFFRELREAFAQQTSAILVERRDQLLAFAVLLHDSQTTTFLLAGLEYGEHKIHQAYQNLLAAIVAEGIQREASCIRLGQTSAEAKSRFGAVEEGRHIYLKATNPLIQAGLRAGLPYLFPTTEAVRRRVFRHEHQSGRPIQT